MNADHQERERVRERQIDAGLSSYPVAPLPQNFTSQVMAQVAATQQEAGPMTAPADPTDTLRHYLRLYSFELACSIVFTLSLALVVAWPLFIPVDFWSSTLTADAPLMTRLADSFSSWYALGLWMVILVELGSVVLAWLAWVEQPRLKVR